jgi:methionyl-tRNA formyltransferase
MNILFLTNDKADHVDEIIDLVQMYGDKVIIHHSGIDIDFVKQKKIDYILSDRYSHIIKRDVIDYLNGNAINTHPSLLPFQRGYQPNFFSILLNTKKGVSIHKIDEGLDTGDIIVQEELFYNDQDTLKTSHYIFRKAIVSLLCKNWYKILNENILPIPQERKGNINYKKDFDIFFAQLSNGWCTTVEEVKNILKNKPLIRVEPKKFPAKKSHS